MPTQPELSAALARSPLVAILRGVSPWGNKTARGLRGGITVFERIERGLTKTYLSDNSTHRVAE